MVAHCCVSNPGSKWNLGGADQLTSCVKLVKSGNKTLLVMLWWKIKYSRTQTLFFFFQKCPCLLVSLQWKYEWKTHTLWSLTDGFITRIAPEMFKVICVTKTWQQTHQKYNSRHKATSCISLSGKWFTIQVTVKVRTVTHRKFLTKLFGHEILFWM